jgi:cytochrome c5
MKRAIRRLGLAVVGVMLVVAAGVLAFAWREAADFDASVGRFHATPAVTVVRSNAPESLARGKQLAESVGACTASNCHGPDLGGGRTVKMGPAAILTAPNITGAKLGVYSDEELARLLRYGVKRDGTGVRVMPVQNFAWLSDEDVGALISWIRMAPPVERDAGTVTITVVGKVLDRRGRAVFDVARFLEKNPPDTAPKAAPAASYGRFVARACTMCHGEHLSGGRIPGAPSSLPVPLNLTPDPSGLAGWSYEDFNQLLTTGIRRNGKRLDPFMPYESFANYDEVQKRALWAYLRSLPPAPLGGR